MYLYDLKLVKGDKKKNCFNPADKPEDKEKHAKSCIQK